MSGARLRYLLCYTCHRIARITVFGTSESATYYVPDIPARHYPDMQGALCATCTSHCWSLDSVDYNAMYNIIPIALSHCIRLSYKAQRWISVDCEDMLASFDSGRYDELVAKVQQHFPSAMVVSGGTLRKLIVANFAVSDRR